MKKQSVLDALVQYVKQQKYNKGDKLPAERVLAGILETSRATVREAVRMLEERGIVTVKRGSGLYLNKNADAGGMEDNLRPPDRETGIKDLLEARFMITPVIIRCGAARATEPEITELRDCIVNMSRTIVARDLDLLVEADSRFHRLLAVMTRNHKLVNVMEQLNSGNETFWEYFIKNDEFVNNVIFAGYVEIVNAIKKGDPVEAAEVAKRNIINACEWLSKIEETPYCNVLEAIKEQAVNGKQKTKLFQ